jgi:hypothetical protein
MRPDLKSFRVNDRYVICANLGLQVVALDGTHSIVWKVDLNADCRDTFSLSRDGGLLATAFAYEGFCAIEVVDVHRTVTIPPRIGERVTLSRLDHVHALDVRLAPDGQTLFYYKHGKRAGTYVAHMPSGSSQRLADTRAPSNGAWMTHHVILPFRRKKGAIKVTYWPITVTSVELPCKHGAWRLIDHPSAERLAMLSLDEVANLRAGTLEPLWRRRIPEAGWISYSGDGRFIAVREHAPDGGQAERIILLDENSGEVVRRIDEPGEHALFPLDGPRFLCYSGRFVNAETGEFEEGVSQPGFWDAVLKQWHGSSR